MDQGRGRIPVASDHVPETGKYNPGQKAFFDRSLICGLLMVVTGFFMWYPEKLGGDLMDWVYVLHVLGFVRIFAFFFVHLYLGTIGNPGSVSAMISGKMELPVFENASSEVGQRDGT